MHEKSTPNMKKPWINKKDRNSKSKKCMKDSIVKISNSNNKWEIWFVSFRLKKGKSKWWLRQHRKNLDKYNQQIVN